MPYTYTNRKGKTYYIRRVEGKRGVRFVCSQKKTDDVLDAIPEGFEMVENPNGQVSCRRKQKSLITDDELKRVEKLVAKLCKGKDVKVERKKKEVILHEVPDGGGPDLAELGFLPGAAAKLQEFMHANRQYEPVLKFTLDDAKSRTFRVERMTWTAGEGWMYLASGDLESLVREYAPHIGEESFFELL